MANVLFIEPNVKLGRLYCEFLTRAGFAAHQQFTCGQGLEYLSQSLVPNMIIIDAFLAVEDLSALMNYLGNDEQFRHTQVVMMIESENRQQEAETLGIQHFLSKPVSLPMLLTFVSSILDKSVLQ